VIPQTSPIGESIRSLFTIPYPRRSGPAEGGENFIITTEELRPSLQAQCKEEDQVVWMTTAQVGFPTTTTEGDLDNDLRPVAGETYG
jgi:hypothetical protein